MKQKTLWKDIFRAIKASMGRFLSLLFLMALGSFALVGLKVAGPNMEKTASHYLEEHQVMDLSILASHGFSDRDKQELASLKNARLEYASFVDGAFDHQRKAIRLYSMPQSLSQASLVKGDYPSKASDILLSEALSSRYRLGQTITISLKTKGLLKHRSYRVVGFAHSPEIWSKTNLGVSSAGDGNLYAYAYLHPSAFQQGHNLLRIRYDDLRGMNAFSSQYSEGLLQHQAELDQLLQDNGQERYEEMLNDLNRSLKDSKAKLEEQRTILKASEDQLALSSGHALEQAQDQLKQGREELAKKETSLLEMADKQRAAMIKPTYASYSRSTLPGGEGYQAYATSTQSISHVGNIFPVVLYLVAALVAFTTMARYVDEERTNSGLLKAIGYSDWDITKKFLLYGALAALLGTGLGVLGGTYFLSRLISAILTDALTIGSTQLYFYWSYSVVAVLLALLSAVLPAYMVVRRELFLRPSQLLLPKPPSSGARIWLEHVSFIWRRLSFTYKVTFRNIFRYKQRMLMTVIGVAGSVALLFSGLGIQSSLANSLSYQFGKLIAYDMLVVEAPTAEAHDRQELAQYLKADQIASKKEIYYANLSLKIKDLDNKQTVSLISSDQSTLSPYFSLIGAADRKKLDLPSTGVLISKKLADYYQAHAGDQLELEASNGKRYQLRVSQVIDMTVGHYLFMSKSYYRQVFQDIEASPAYLVTTAKASPAAVKDVASQLLAMPAVQAVSQHSSIAATVTEIVASLDQVMTLLVLLSVLLALVILYHLTNINIAERIRELSTIRVLGFYDKEVTLYIYRETMLLSTVGILIGLWGGSYLHAYIMKVIANDSMSFGRTVDAYVYLVPVGAIVLLLIVLGYMVSYRLRKIDMLEALKSVD
ncbi:TPA: FtsX-like permease family protein [Streptococcus equi subsp. zooepidemicus]|nr:FtsX-like permease family protein [Streptococcus equi subsp. zooepidemicus]HEL0170038.1 FtsX-like permease family protein [Streptococcus equi subsp. zooepidemicus]HEL0186115.1 FtsX-like permease family protein [Streptococcus equi subsp. zooepidemicus]HEL0192032.1 FtsX-like permease family protein [Streptococcus equi subsp. zooepidemicus]HEL0198021.1 FtsX-like permease family protein [Streptococcus equi subsp. zooepidemicus]